MAVDIEDLRANLTQSLNKLERDIESLDSKDQVSRVKAIRKIGEFIKEVEDDIQSYGNEVIGVSNKVTNKYQESLNQINLRFENLKKNFDKKKIAGTDRERLFKGIKKKDDKDPSSMQTEEVIQRIVEIQDNDDDALLRIEGNVEQFNDMADTINAQLDEQIKKLDQVNQIAKDTETEIKRTARYIRQFLRSVYTDKILMCLIFLIFCAIVTLIVLNITGVGDKIARTVDTVKKKTASSDTTTTTTIQTRFLDKQKNINQNQININILSEIILSVLF